MSGTPRVCNDCGTSIPVRDMGAHRRWNCITWTATRNRERRTGLVEEVTELLEWGEAVDEIARRLGRTVAAVEIALRRAGRPDLANVFERGRRRWAS